MTKRCRKCHEVKGLDLFHFDKRQADGHRNTCRACVGLRMAEWKRTPAGQEANRRRQLRKYYKITPAEYDELLASQGGVCRVCKSPPRGRRLDVDHDHSCCPGSTTCGKCIRGLLCQECNRGLGQFKDQAELLLEAAMYLIESRLDGCPAGSLRIVDRMEPPLPELEWDRASIVDRLQ